MNSFQFKAKQLDYYNNKVMRYSEGFSYVFLGFENYNDDVLTADGIGNYISLMAAGKCIKLLFHTHAWCGRIRIVAGNKSQEMDLFTHEHGWKTVEIADHDGLQFPISIETIECTSEGCRGNQVWLCSVEFDEMPLRQTQSFPISRHATITHGLYGTYLTLANDITIGAVIARDGAWAAHDLELMSQYITPGMLVLDVGANIGHHTVAFSEMVGSKGRVVAFEPQTTISRVLAANTIINGCFNIDIVHACVGEGPGTVNLYPINYEGTGNFGALGVDPDPEGRGSDAGEVCRIDSLDNFISELKLENRPIGFIKIDVQTYELFVLRGARSILEKWKPVIFLEVSPYWMAKLYDYKEIYEFLWSVGYKIYHPIDPSVPADIVKEWNGDPQSEWDIIAIGDAVSGD